jgi:hypothetical protein
MPGNDRSGLTIVREVVVAPAATFTRTLLEGSAFGVDGGGYGALQLVYFTNVPADGAAGGGGVPLSRVKLGM